jgi:hypothetical protein
VEEIEFDKMEDIKELKILYSKFLKLCKQIIDKQSSAFIPLCIDSGLEPSHDYIANDYIYFCFTKFTKTSLAIEKLCNAGFYEDALILTRSNYESYIYAKAVANDPDLIYQLVDFRLGLIGEKDFKWKDQRKRLIVSTSDPKEVHYYIDKVWTIAKSANEEFMYHMVYKYLCEITHCDFLTLGYYQDGETYTYKAKSLQAFVNVLTWNNYFNIKFLPILINNTYFDTNELISAVDNLVIEGCNTLSSLFEDEIVFLEFALAEVDDDPTELKKHIEDLKCLRENMLDTKKGILTQMRPIYD